MSATKSEAKAENWIKNLQNGNIKSKTMQVIKFIKDNPKCNLEIIRDKTGLPHQTVTGCLSRVMDEGLVKFVGKIESNNNVYSLLEYVTDMSELYRLKNQRDKEKMVRWANNGINKFKPMLSSATINCLIDIKNKNK
jgi:predicted transcriptional regulator